MSCLKCSQPIIGKRSDAKYCSVKCREVSKQRRFVEANPDRANAIWAKYAATTKGKVTLLLNNASDRAKRYNVPFDLDRNFVLSKLEKGTCELTGLTFNYEVSAKFRCNPLAPSLDRKTPNLGYTKDNTRLIVFCLNMALSDWGEEAFRLVAESYIKQLSITK